MVPVQHRTQCSKYVRVRACISMVQNLTPVHLPACVEETRSDFFNSMHNRYTRTQMLFSNWMHCIHVCVRTRSCMYNAGSGPNECYHCKDMQSSQMYSCGESVEMWKLTQHDKSVTRDRSMIGQWQGTGPETSNKKKDCFVKRNKRLCSRPALSVTPLLPSLMEQQARWSGWFFSAATENSNKQSIKKMNMHCYEMLPVI